MNKEEMNDTLNKFRVYTAMVRREWEDKSPAWIPLWVRYFEAIDESLSRGGPLPSDWEVRS